MTWVANRKKLWIVLTGPCYDDRGYVLTSADDADIVLSKVLRRNYVSPDLAEHCTAESIANLLGLDLEADPDLDLTDGSGDFVVENGVHYPRVFKIEAPVVLGEWVPTNAPEGE